MLIEFEAPSGGPCWVNPRAVTYVRGVSVGARIWLHDAEPAEVAGNARDIVNRIQGAMGDQPETQAWRDTSKHLPVIGVAVVAWWSITKRQGVARRFVDHWHDCCGLVVDPPSHWHELPKPPNA